MALLLQVRGNCLWALSALAWNGTNQERIGRFFEEVFDLCEFPDVGAWLLFALLSLCVCALPSLFM